MAGTADEALPLLLATYRRFSICSRNIRSRKTLFSANSFHHPPPRFGVLVYQSSGPPHGSFTLARGCSQCRTSRRWRCSRREHPELWTSYLPQPSERFQSEIYQYIRGACGSSQRRSSCRSGLLCTLTTGEVRSSRTPLSGWLNGALVPPPAARLHSPGHGRAGGL
jgi:hypothetical protein